MYGMHVMLTYRSLSQTPSCTHILTHVPSTTEEGNPPAGEEGQEEQQQQQQGGGGGEEGAGERMMRPYFEVPWYRTHHLQQQGQQVCMWGSELCVRDGGWGLVVWGLVAWLINCSVPPKTRPQKGGSGKASSKQAQHQVGRHLLHTCAGRSAPCLPHLR